MAESGCGRVEAGTLIEKQINFIKAHKDEIVAAMDIGPILDAIGEVTIERAKELAEVVAKLKEARLRVQGRVRANADEGSAMSGLSLPDRVLR